MSSETMEWLRTNTRIGFTDKRGPAWHAANGTDSENHYPGPVPMKAVESLFDFRVIERPLYMPDSDPANDGGFVKVPDRKAMVHESTGDVLGIFTEGFQGHDYKEWLVNNVATLLDADLKIGSAGLLKKGAVGFVQIELEETLTVPGIGEDYRVFLAAYTSYDGSFATTYRRGSIRTQCDNTLSSAAAEVGSTAVKYRHSSNSLSKIYEARQALNVLETVSDEFNAEVKALCETPVTDAQFAQFLELEVPDKDSKAGHTRATDRRDVLTALYKNDPRVSTFAGTAFGVWQMANTYRQHEAPVQKKTERFERNTLNFLRGKVEKDDQTTMKNLQLVLSNV